MIIFVEDFWVCFINKKIRPLLLFLWFCRWILVCLQHFSTIPTSIVDFLYLPRFPIWHAKRSSFSNKGSSCCGLLRLSQWMKYCFSSLSIYILIVFFHVSLQMFGMVKKGEKDVWHIICSLQFVGVIVLSVCVVCFVSPRKFCTKKKTWIFLIIEIKNL